MNWCLLGQVVFGVCSLAFRQYYSIMISCHFQIILNLFIIGGNMNPQASVFAGSGVTWVIHTAGTIFYTKEKIRTKIPIKSGDYKLSDNNIY